MNGNYPKVFTRHERLLHDHIAFFCLELIRCIDGKDKKQPTLSWCHLMADIVSRTFPVTLIDGTWHKFHQHSWVETEKGNIIDVSPIACRSMAIMYPPQKLKDFGNVQWSVVFVKGNFKNQKQISKIRESDKYQNALNFAIVESREIRERVQKQYLKYCKFHKIKPLQLPAL